MCLPLSALRLSLLLGLIASLACTSQPLPLSAQAGSSVALAVGGEATYGTSLGYGGTLLSAEGLYDDQRGELVFVAVDPGSGAEHPLENQLVTRTQPDPASDAGIASQLAGDLAPYGISQPIAILRIPETTPPGTYDLRVQRRRRSESGGFVTLVGPPIAQRLHVLPAEVNGIRGAATPLLGFAGVFGIDVSMHLRALYPHPKLLVRLPSVTRAAAAQLVLAYPAQKIELLSVFEEQHAGRGSIVAWHADGAGQATIELVDPTLSVSALAVAFELRDPLGAGRASVSDFSWVSTRFYDSSGALQGGSATLGPIR